MTRGSDVLALYGDEPWLTRLHVGVRWRTCPFQAVSRRVPPEGRILEIGCGHGVFSALLALQSDGREVVGTDVDGDKIRAASRAGAGVANLRFDPAEPGDLPAGPWDAVCIIDVLYLIDRAGERALLEAAAAALAPGGVMVVKEMATGPRWKFQLMALQERLSVQILGITHGHGLTFVPPVELAGWLTEAGLDDVAHLPLHAGHLHPHHLITARRPSGPE